MSSAASLIAALDAPWRDGRPCVHDRINAAIETGGALPDLFSAIGEGDLHLAPGAADSLPGAPDELAHGAAARRIAAALNHAARHPHADSVRHLYALLKDCEAISVVDQILPRIAEESAAHRDALAALARRIAREAPDAEAVKIALALLGVFGAAEDDALIQSLGRHDELTLFAAVALGNLAGDADEAIWTLAQNVHGWGRIQAVERLQHTKDRRIRDWMLRDGFRNTVSDSHLACLCARAGGLRDALSAPRIDPALLRGAADILTALSAEDAEEDIGAYEDGPAVALTYLDHVAKAPARDLRHLLTAHLLCDLAGDPRISHWAAQTKFALRTKGRAELGRPDWRALAEAGAAREEADAIRAAALLGLGA